LRQKAKIHQKPIATGHLFNSTHDCEAPFVNAALGHNRNDWRLWHDPSAVGNEYFFSPIVYLHTTASDLPWLSVRAHYAHLTMRDRIFYPAVFEKK
jgi:hypothetical protein